MPSARGCLIGVACIALATTLSYALTWDPVDQQPAGGVGYDVSAGKETVFVCVKPAGIDADARVYRSTTAGSAWTEVLKDPDLLAVEAFPTAPHIVYAGGVGLGVFKSTDGGGAWNACTNGMGAANISTIAVAPSDSWFVYAAGGRPDIDGGRAPVYRTTNGGGNWVDVTPDIGPYLELAVSDLAVHPTMPDIALLSCVGQNPTYRGIYRTTNGGDDWTQVWSSQSVYCLAIAQSDPTVVYAGREGGVIIKSTDGGQNWTATQSAPSGGTYSLAVHPNDDEMVYALVSGSGVWQSTNGGASWSQCATGMLLKSVEHARICMDNASPSTLYAGEEHAGLYGTTNAGTNWQQVSTWMPCRDIRKLVTEDSSGYYWTYDNDIVLDITTDGGGMWASTWWFGASAYADMVHPVADTVLFAKVRGDPVGGEDVAGFGIVRSTDRGFTWYPVFDTASGNNSALYQFGVAPSDPEIVYGASSVGGGPRILKSEDCGSNWTFPENSYGTYPYCAVAVSADDPDLVYFGCRDGRVVKSDDGGYSVSYVGKLSDNYLTSPIEIRRLVLGIGEMMYAGTDSGVYVSCDRGEHWVQSISGMGSNYNIVDLVMDPNGSALWAASLGPTSGAHVYVLYNGTTVWQTETDGLPINAAVYSLSFDSDRCLHAGTSVGVFTLDVRGEGQIGADATYPNWSKKLARDADNDILHVVYTGNNTVFYKQSTDEGETWSTPEVVGYGKYPAIALNMQVADTLLAPWVVYLTPDSSIMRAIRTAPGVWDQAAIYTASGSRRAGSPSLAVGITANPWLPAYVTYPVYVGSGPDSCYVYFNSFTPSTISTPEFVHATTTYCYGTSVAANPDGYQHVVWIRSDSVFYSKRAGGSWTAPFLVSQPSGILDPQPAANPALEAYGDSLHCVWRGPHDALRRNYTYAVCRRSKRFANVGWESPWRVSYAPDSVSDFPVMTTYYATAWHQESTTENYDIWGEFLGYAPQRFFQTSLMSRYPHVTGYWYNDGGQTRFKCNVIWTEETSTEYAVDFGVVNHDFLLLKGDDHEPGTYYAAKLGQSEPSPYCRSRGGYAQYESWNVDTSSSVLTYELPYLDPRGTFQLRAIIYHEGKDSLCADVRCDSGDWIRVHVGPRTPDTVWVQVPKRLYRNDGRMVLEMARVSGNYAALAELRFFQIEDRSRRDEGVQGRSGPGALVTRLLGSAPNPFGRVTAINYQLGGAGAVVLTLHDVTGRTVRRLASGPQPAGFHSVVWDGKDDKGRALPAGVYYCRMQAGATTETKRVTLVR